LILGPKIEDENSRGTRFHAKELMTVEGYKWEFEEQTISIAPTRMLLVRIMIGKVEKLDKVLQIIRSIPIRPDREGWNCVGWIQEALEALGVEKKAMGTSVMDWKTVRDTAMEYCQKKRDAHRFDGKDETSDKRKAPTYDLIEGRETQA